MYPDFQENCSLGATEKNKLINNLQECNIETINCWTLKMLAPTAPQQNILHKWRESATNFEDPPTDQHDPRNLNDLERLGDAIGAYLDGMAIHMPQTAKMWTNLLLAPCTKWMNATRFSLFQSWNIWYMHCYALIFHRSATSSHFELDSAWQNATPMTSRRSSGLTVLVHPSKDSRSVTWLVEPTRDFMLLFERRKGTLYLYNI